MITVKQKIAFSRDKTRRRRAETQSVRATDVPPGRIPRISKLMALAIRFDGLLREGLVPDLSELARLAKVTQPRMTQILNLTLLAPDIQEELLFLPRVTSGKSTIHEKMLRPLAAEIDWTKQRKMWDDVP
jgi:hypothetical protein